MNNSSLKSSPQAVDKFGAMIAGRLSATVDDLPHDISERLRAARVQAVDKRKWVMTQTAPTVFAHSHSGTLTAGHGEHHASWWSRLGAVGLLLTLVLGLFAINLVQDEMRARELADIDSALLTDDLPPAAYVDAGFAQFLKTVNHKEQ